MKIEIIYTDDERDDLDEAFHAIDSALSSIVTECSVSIETIEDCTAPQRG